MLNLGLRRYYIEVGGCLKHWSLSHNLIVSKTRYRNPQILVSPPRAPGPEGVGATPSIVPFHLRARDPPCSTASAIASRVPRRARVHRNRHMFVTFEGRSSQVRSASEAYPPGCSSAQRKGLPERICRTGPEAVLTARGLMESPVDGLKRMDWGSDHAEGCSFPVWAGSWGGQSWREP